VDAHNGTKMHGCDSCDKTFVTDVLLQQHVERVSTLFRFVLFFCFLLPDGLFSHQKPKFE
jgi:hypothetical protein